MILYATVTNPITKECNVGLGNNESFYKSIGMEKLEVEQSYNGAWFLKGYAPQKPHNQTILEQIESLEGRITERNIRAAIMGDEFAINKINDIEAQIAELRKQLEGDAQ